MPLVKTETLTVRNVVDATRLGAWLRSGEGTVSDGSRLALCRILSTIECPSSIFFWHVYFVILVSFSLSFLKKNLNAPRPSELCLFVFFFCSHWRVVVPLILFCPAEHVSDWQPRILLDMVEARSVNVKKTTTAPLCEIIIMNPSIFVFLYNMTH